MENLPTVKEGGPEEEFFLKRIKDRFGITDERFPKGVEFAMMIADGKKATPAYMLVFDVDKEEANKKSSGFKHAKWVQELIKFYKFDDEMEYIGETKDTIGVMHKIVMDPSLSPRERTEAAKAMQGYVKMEKEAARENSEELTEAKQLIKGLMGAVAMLVQNGKMINPQGEIIDVELLD